MLKKTECWRRNPGFTFSPEVKSQTQQENATKMKIWKITTAKFKCTREHILGHDWLTKIT